MKYIHLKRFFDIIVSLVILIISIPISILTFLLLSLSIKGLPLFFQIRPGKGNKLFCIIKFKTMNDRRDRSGNLLPDEMRLTKIGKIVRKLSIDELPQLINVLKGDMSLIGPRPLLPEYLAHYTPEQARRHEVRPGITGWAQVNGRNSISWKKKFEYDVWYVDNISFKVDFKIILITIVNVINRKDINQNNFATVDFFNGNN